MKTPRLPSLSLSFGADRRAAGLAEFLSAQGPKGKLALALSALWALVALVLYIAFPQGQGFTGAGFVWGVLGAILPLGLVVLGLMLAEIGALLASEAAPAPAPVKAPVAEDLVPPAMPPISVPPARTSPKPPEPEAPAPQLDTVVPLSREEMIRALNFPDSGDDLPGFAALRRALAHPSARGTVQSAQDILTLFSQDGIYMDDLRPALVAPIDWRAYANGVRGEALNGIGVFAEETLVLRMAERLQKDAIFRDAVQHFLRNFDRMFADFEDGADDEEVAAMSETRSARAFMLAGRAARIFG